MKWSVEQLSALCNHWACWNQVYSLMLLLRITNNQSGWPPSLTRRWTEITLTSEQSFALPDSSCRGCRGEDKHASLLRDQIPLNPPIFPLLGGGLEVGGGSVSTSPPLLSFHGDVTGICECQGAARADLSLGWDGTAGGFIFPRVHLHRKPSVLRI